MKTTIKVEERIKGCLTGAAIGAELGWARRVCPARFNTDSPAEVMNLELKPAGPYKQHPNRIQSLKSTPLIELGVRTYLKKQGRVTPEDFAGQLQRDRKIARPAFGWDLLHTTQELLNEGSHPRLSGLGTAPAGLMVAAMPAVGIYHFADPEYAYLDGMELASVAQPRLGADWAGLAAAAVAAAFDPAKGPDDIVKTVLDLAFENNKDVFYELNSAARLACRFNGCEKAENMDWWFQNHGSSHSRREINWIANNPLRFVLPLLQPFDSDPQELMAILLRPSNSGDLVNPILAGAILGARHGRKVFPKAWLNWGEPTAKSWFPITKVVATRRKKEKEIIAIRSKLSTRKRNGMSLLCDKIYGCLLASSIGNAMGSPVEGMLYTEIDKKYPGGVKTILDPGRLESEDDNQMAMHLGETYLARNGKPVLARHFGATWHEHLNRDHFYALCMGNSYDLIRAGWDPRITGHWNVVTGSTVMCMEPVGIYHIADPEFAAIDATAISYMYQRGLDVTAAAILAAAVAEALRPDATVESVCSAALTAAPSDGFRTFDRRRFKSCHDYIETCLNVADRCDDVMTARKKLCDKCLLYHHIDPLELLGLALAMFKIAKGNVRPAAIGGTNIGRDSDTIAGRAAMLAGALRGAGNVPKEWIRMFGPAALKRIRDNAGRLADLVEQRRTR